SPQFRSRSGSSLWASGWSSKDSGPLRSSPLICERRRERVRSEKARRAFPGGLLRRRFRLLDDEGDVHPERVVRGLVAYEYVVARLEIESEGLGLGRVKVAALALAAILGHLSGLVRVW